MKRALPLETLIDSPRVRAALRQADQSVIVRALMGASLLLLLIFPIWTIATAHDHLPRGTRIGIFDVSGMSASDAETSVRKHVDELARETVHVTMGDSTTDALPGDLGITYNAESALQQLTAIDGNFGFASGKELPIDVSVDGTRMAAFLDRLDGSVSHKAVDASVTLKDGTFIVTPGTSGDRVDRAAFADDVVAQATSLSPIRVTAKVVSGEPAVSNDEAKQAAQAANAAIGTSWTLHAGDTPVTVDGKTLAPAIDFASNLDGSVKPAFDSSALDPILSTALKDVEANATKDAEVKDVGGVQYLFASSEGVTIDHAGTIDAMNAALASGTTDVTLPVTSSAPKVTTDDLMKKMGITELIASGNSIYDGSGDGRRHNVETAAKAIDGTLVEPGGTFSFNAAVGDLFDGRFESAGSYIDGPDGMSVAGGVCQVSTTVYRAALRAGFPIVEWYPHSFRSGFYELGGWTPGYDAAIVQDSIVPSDSTDMKFSNPTDSWVLVRASTAGNGELKVDIYSAPTGWTVTFDDPVIETTETAPATPLEIVDEQLPTGTVETTPPMDGLRVTVVRHVRDAKGSVVSDDTITSTYGAYGGIRRVSPDMAGKN